MNVGFKEGSQGGLIEGLKTLKSLLYLFCNFYIHPLVDKQATVAARIFGILTIFVLSVCSCPEC